MQPSGWDASFPQPEYWPSFEPEGAAQVQRRRLEIETRIATQQLNATLPSFEAFGLSTAGAGEGGGIRSEGGEGRWQPWERERMPTNGEGQYTQSGGAPYPPPQQHYPLQHLPSASLSSSSSASYALPPAPSLPFLPSAPPPPSSHYPSAPAHEQNLASAWDYQISPDGLAATGDSLGMSNGEIGVVGGMGQMRAASGDYGQPYRYSSGGGGVPYDGGEGQGGQSFVGGYAATSGMYPPPVQQQQRQPQQPSFQQHQQQQEQATMQSRFKQHWQQQAPLDPLFPSQPRQHQPYPTPHLETSPVGAHSAYPGFVPPPSVPSAAEPWPTPSFTPPSSFIRYQPLPADQISPVSLYGQQEIQAIDAAYPPQNSLSPQQPLLPTEPSASFGYPLPLQEQQLSFPDPPTSFQPLSIPSAPVVPPPEQPFLTLNDVFQPPPSLPDYSALISPPHEVPPPLQPPPISSSVSPVVGVDFAAWNAILQQAAPKRSRLDSAASSSGGNASRRPSTTTATKPAVAAKPGKKLTVELNADCVGCGTPIARLILRGKSEAFAVPHAAVFRCLPCTQGSQTSPCSQDSPTSTTSPEASTSASTTVKRPSIAKAKPPSYRKKSKRLDDASATTACDVCLRDIAAGSVLPTPLDNPPPSARIDFTVEVIGLICGCDAKYQRCTDCGGGGGARAGTGKWRSKELFPVGRKTCVLPHQRLGAFTEMSYETFKVVDVPRDEVEELSEKCGEIFKNQMLSGICNPEVLEQDGAIWKTYAEAKQRATLGWLGLDPILRYDIEKTTGIRRYLSLRTCTPNLRKSQKLDEETSPKPVKENPVVLRDGKEVVGYILAEYELKLGHVFLAIVIPWDPTGETFDATTLLIGNLMRRVDADIRTENAERASRGEELLPNLKNVWTMLFFTKNSSRVLGSLVKKRDFLFSDDFFKKYPETDPLDFPPHRPIYLPRERQAGWQLLIRRQKNYNTDGPFDDWNARRGIDEARGKKKELKGKKKDGAAEEAS